MYRVQRTTTQSCCICCELSRATELSESIFIVNWTSRPTLTRNPMTGDWHRKAGLILSIQRPHIFAVMESQVRPTEEIEQAD